MRRTRPGRDLVTLGVIFGSLLLMGDGNSSGRVGGGNFQPYGAG
jgi:hypothetical protein